MDSRYYYIHKEIITSFKYDTLSIDDILLSDPQSIIKYINDKREKEAIDHIRLKCTSTVDNQDTINILKEYYRLDKGVKFQINKKSSSVINDTQSSLYNQYDYLFNRSMSPYDILAKFINESQSDIMVTSDQIISALKEI